MTTPTTFAPNTNVRVVTENGSVFGTIVGLSKLKKHAEVTHYRINVPCPGVGVKPYDIYAPAEFVEAWDGAVDVPPASSKERPFEATTPPAPPAAEQDAAIGQRLAAEAAQAAPKAPKAADASTANSIVDFVAGHPGASKSEILEAVKLGADQWNETITAMILAGQVTRTGIKRGTRYFVGDGTPLPNIPTAPPVATKADLTKEKNIIVAQIKAGGPAGKSGILAATNLPETAWNQAIRELVAAGTLVQDGTKRGAMYALPGTAIVRKSALATAVRQPLNDDWRIKADKWKTFMASTGLPSMTVHKATKLLFDHMPHAEIANRLSIPEATVNLIDTTHTSIYKS